MTITVLFVALIILIVVLGSIYCFESNKIGVIAPCPNSFNLGHYSEYGGGSSTDCLFVIPRSGDLTGAFVANASFDFIIQTDNQFNSNAVGSIPI